MSILSFQFAKIFQRLKKNRQTAAHEKLANQGNLLDGVDDKTVI